MGPRWLRPLIYGVGDVFFRLSGRKTLRLITVGAKSGREHEVPLLGFADGPDAWLIVASAGGSAKHPAWYYNMARNPDKIWAQMAGRGRLRVNAESLTGAAREAAWQKVVSSYAGYQTYATKTDREIPVVRLTPAA